MQRIRRQGAPAGLPQGPEAVHQQHPHATRHDLVRQPPVEPRQLERLVARAAEEIVEAVADERR